MSGQQIGTVLGGVIGFYFGGPSGAQLGMAIGGTIGGIVDPTKINGPHIGDGQQQTSTDGAPIAWVLGTAKIAGTLCWAGPRTEVKIKDSGKGGPVVSHYESRQSFAILVCESSELKNSTISSVLMVEQDGKLVYDVRPGSTMVEDSAKWAANVTFYYGAEDQMPPPVIEADVGVGNCPGYRGVLLMVAENFNTYAAGDRIPTFKFTVSAVTPAVIRAQSMWKYVSGISTTNPVDYSDPDVDDSAWAVGRAPFGNLAGDVHNVGQNAVAFNPALSSIIATVWPHATVGWIRNRISIPSGTSLRLFGWFDNGFKLYIGGQLVASGQGGDGYGGTDVTVPAGSFPAGSQVIAVRCQDDPPATPGNVSYFDFALLANQDAMENLGSSVQRIALRGGLGITDVDIGDLFQKPVRGYPIARQCTALDALTPLLQAYFAFATDYDSKLRFKFYGEDAQLTVDDGDLIEGNDANHSAITENTRNQATEFPRRIVGSYVDPDQNYEVVNVSTERSSGTVIAIGDQQLAIPVVMSANDAKQAVDKALKVAYATLEGTRDYCVPFARTANYLIVCAGEPVLMDGKRWVLDQIDLSNGYLKFSTRYDRQSAYTSNVQAIIGNAPRTPTSRYSGPTTLIPMNLPSLRPQDTYGVYLAAKGTNDQTNWRGCNVQVSFDGQQSWQNALTITIGSVLGTLAAEIPSGGEPLTVNVGGDELDSVTAEQIAAQMNAFALIDSSDVAEIGQFQTATLSGNDYDLTDVSRELLGTSEGTYVVGDQFVMLESVYFFPIDLAFASQTLYFRAVGFGEVAEEANVVSIVYDPDTTVVIDGGEVT